jgi:esterase/lipase superfamily enzyme
MAVEHTMEKEALTQEKQALLAEKEELETKSEDQKVIDILSLLECHDPTKYRAKIKGFNNAFGSRASRISQDVSSSRYKFRIGNKHTAEELRKNVEELRIKRL